MPTCQMWRESRRPRVQQPRPAGKDKLLPARAMAHRRPPSRVASGRSIPSSPGRSRAAPAAGRYPEAGGQPRVLSACGGELQALFQVAGRPIAAGVPVGVLLDGQVPHVPGVAAVVPQHRLLGGGGDQPVPGHANTLSNATDISGEVTRRFLPSQRTGRSTPRLEMSSGPWPGSGRRFARDHWRVSFPADSVGIGTTARQACPNRVTTWFRSPVAWAAAPVAWAATLRTLWEWMQP